MTEPVRNPGVHSGGIKIGYARCSTDGQDTAAQVAALTAAGCEVIFEEKATSRIFDRPKLQLAMARLKPGDVLVVWKLDRLTRSVRDLILLVDKIAQAGALFQSLTEVIDTTNAVGTMVMNILSVFAQFERDVLRERTMAGLKHARTQGRIGGRRYKLLSHQRAEIVRAVTHGEHTAAYMARMFRVHPSTITRLLEQAKVNLKARAS